MKSSLVIIVSMALPLLALSETEPSPRADYVSLEGRPVFGGNPIDVNQNAALITHFQSPVLWLFRSKVKAPQGTVILCPGGAYCALEMRNEGENTARFLNEQGFDVAILEYHIASGAEEYELALADAVKTFRLLKSSAPSIGLHNGRIEIMGYSAGGHLAARTVQNLGEDEQPDGLILVYPAYLNETVPGNATDAVKPPHRPGRLFALIARNDNPEWVKSSQSYAATWKEAGGDTTFHLLSDGGHGFGMAVNSVDSNQHWPDLLKEFLLSKPGLSSSVSNPAAR